MFDLTKRFSCSEETVSNITHPWIKALRQVLYGQFMAEIPSREKINYVLLRYLKNIETPGSLLTVRKSNPIVHMN